MPIGQGSVLDNRFEMEQAIGSGGMGTVYRARDRFSNQWVAVKLMRAAAATDVEVERFHSESKLLSELRHPHIVSYVAHGQTHDGQLYLAMEWLTGEDLGQRLRRGPLPIADCLTLLSCTASALATAHARGIVHRDIKPANLFLPAGQTDRVKLLDFGVARQGKRADGMTRTGVLLGTPEYMAPEQVRGRRELGPAADIFSLGSVLYECLTGQPPFAGEHIPAVLMRILFEEPVAASSRRSGIPKGLAALLSRMLNKDPVARPRDASTLLSEMGSVLAAAEAGDLGQSKDNLPALRVALGSEQELMCVLLIESLIDSREDAISGETLPTGGRFSNLRYQQAADVLKDFSARSDWLMTGELVVTLGGLHDAVDLATKAARCALALSAIFDGPRVAMATGRGSAENSMPVGEVIDRAAAMLRSNSAGDSQEHELDSEAHLSIRVDELSARLLDRRFAVVRRGDGYRLISELKIDEARPLLGKPTACVGRESELGILEALWSGSVEESTAAAVLITGAAGQGKSRLRQEFQRRLRGKGQGFTLLEARAELGSSDSTYDIIGRALRRLCEISGADSLVDQQEKIMARLGKYAATVSSTRTGAFLGELCGVKFPDDIDAVFAAARQDPEVMRGHIQSSFLSFLRDEADQAPILLVLDDLQWADALSVRLIDYVLQHGTDLPILVMMLARPQVHEQYATLWQRRKITQIVLKELTRRACERLIRQVLGVSVSNEIVNRLWERSGGHPLFLEESLRAFIEGASGEQSDTVVAMVQARLGRLPTLARRVIRAASVLGDTFWRGGVAAVLGGTETESDLDQGLQELIVAEFIDRQPQSRLANQQQYGFRHALSREAAYGLLIPEDRQEGHRRAGAFLSEAGEADPLPIAEHFEHGGLPAEAIQFYIQASELSLRRGDISGALQISGRADRCGPAKEVLGHLRAVQANVHACTLDRDAQARASREALSLLRPGSQLWCKAAMSFVTAESARGNMKMVQDWIATMFVVIPDADAGSDFQWLVSMVLWALCNHGDFALSRRVYEFGNSLQHILPSTWVRSRLRLSQSQYLRFVDPDPWRQVEWLREAHEHSTRAEGLDFIVICADFLGESQGELGDFAGAATTLRGSVERAKQAKNEYLTTHAQLHLCELLASSPQRPHAQEAIELARAVLGAAKLSVGYREWAHSLLARALLTLDDPQAAESELTQALALPALSPLRRLLVEALLIECLLAQGRLPDSQAAARSCQRKLDVLGSAGYAEVLVRLALSRAYAAQGDSAAARQQLAAADAEILRRAGKIPDPPSRERYLQGVNEHVRVRHALAQTTDPRPA